MKKLVLTCVNMDRKRGFGNFWKDVRRKSRANGMERRKGSRTDLGRGDTAGTCSRAQGQDVQSWAPAQRARHRPGRTAGAPRPGTSPSCKPHAFALIASLRLLPKASLPALSHLAHPGPAIQAEQSFILLGFTLCMPRNPLPAGGAAPLQLPGPLIAMVTADTRSLRTWPRRVGACKLLCPSSGSSPRRWGRGASPSRMAGDGLQMRALGPSELNVSIKI